MAVDPIIEEVVYKFTTVGDEQAISDIKKVANEKKKALREARQLEKLEARLEKYDKARDAAKYRRIKKYNSQIYLRNKAIRDEARRQSKLPARIPGVDYRTSRQKRLLQKSLQQGQMLRGTETITSGYQNQLLLPMKANRANILENIRKSQEFRRQRSQAKMPNAMNSMFASEEYAKKYGSSFLRFQNKYLRGLKLESLLKKRTAATMRKDGYHSRREVGSLSGITSRAMLYMGFASLAGYMMTGIVSKVMQLGDAVADTELDVQKGLGYRNYYGSKYGNTKGFDEAANLSAYLTGEGKFKARSRIADIAGGLEAAKVDISPDRLKDIAIAAQGINSAFGRDIDTAYKDIIGMLTARRTPEEVGFIGLKGGGSPEAMLDKILKHLKSNPSVAGILGQQTLKATMQSIRSAPKDMLAAVYGSAPTQTQQGLKKFSGFVQDIFDTTSIQGLERWGGVMASINMALDRMSQDGDKTADTLSQLIAGAAQVGSVAYVNLKKVLGALVLYKTRNLWKDKAIDAAKFVITKPLKWAVTKPATWWATATLAASEGLHRIEASLGNRYNLTDEQKAQLNYNMMNMQDLNDLGGQAPIINTQSVYFDSENRMTIDSDMNYGGR